MVRISGFSHGTDVWLNNAQDLITSGTVQLKEAISTRDDIMNYLIQHGIKPKTSFKVMENVRKGKGIDKLNKLGQKTSNYEEELKEGHIPQWFIDSCHKIGYLFPRAHAVAYVMMPSVSPGLKSITPWPITRPSLRSAPRPSSCRL